MASDAANFPASRVVEDIYEAVLLADGWERILTALLEHVGAYRGRYLIRGAVPYTPVFCAIAESHAPLRLDRASVNAAQQGAGTAPGGTAITAGREPAPGRPPSGASVRSRAGPDAADPPAAEIRILDGQLDGALALWCESGDARSRLADRLRELEAHLRRAARIHWAILQARAQANAGLFSLDILHSAAVVVGRAGSVQCANANAKRLLEAKDLLTLSQGRLTTADKDQQGRFAAMLSKTIDQRRSGALKIYHARTRGEVAIVMLPLPLQTDGEMPSPLPFAMILIWRLRRHARPSAELLRTLFSLSAAEAELATTLAGGKTLEEYCRDRGTRMSTARSQLRALFGKTGTNRQADLVRLIGCLPGDPTQLDLPPETTPRQ